MTPHRINVLDCAWRPSSLTSSDHTQVSPLHTELCPHVAATTPAASVCSLGWVLTPIITTLISRWADFVRFSVHAGFMSREERKKFECLHSPYNKYWIPCVWFTNLAALARCEGRIKDDHTLKLLLQVRHHKPVSWTRKHTRIRTDGGFSQRPLGWILLSDLNDSLNLCTGAECVQREVQHAVPLWHDQRSPRLHSGMRSGAAVLQTSLHTHICNWTLNFIHSFISFIFYIGTETWTEQAIDSLWNAHCLRPQLILKYLIVQWMKLPVKQFETSCGFWFTFLVKQQLGW